MEASWTPGRLWADSKLTFGWVTTKEKIRKNRRWTAEIHLESARLDIG